MVPPMWCHCLQLKIGIWLDNQGHGLRSAVSYGGVAVDGGVQPRNLMGFPLDYVVVPSMLYAGAGTLDRVMCMNCATGDLRV